MKLKIYSTDSRVDSFNVYADGVFKVNVPISYPIDITITGGTVSGNTKINKGGTAVITVAADSGYDLPDSITVNGVTGTSGSTGVTWTYSSGQINLSNPTDEVEIGIVCEEQISGYTLYTAANYDKEYCWGDLFLTTNNGNTYYLSEISAGQMIEDNVTSFSLAVSDSWANLYINYTMGGSSGSASCYPSEPYVVELTNDMYITKAVCECLSGDTLVTMADHSTKRLDEIEVGDNVLSFDWDTMELVPNKVIYTDKDEHKSFGQYDVWTFDNGTEIKTIHRHEFYNVEAKRFKYMDEWKIGEHTYCVDGTTPMLIKHEVVSEEINHYKITGELGTNYFANGLLTGDRNCPKNIRIGMKGVE